MHTSDPYDLVYSKLRENGVCRICSFRFLNNSDLCKIHTDEIFERHSEPEGEANCVICLDLFKDTTVHLLKEDIQEKIAKCEYDCPTYMLALSLPASCKIRESTTFGYLKSTYPDLYANCPYAPHLGIKEAWRYHLNLSLSKIIGKNIDSKSELIINVKFANKEEDEKHKKLMKLKMKELNIKSELQLYTLEETKLVQLFPFPLQAESAGHYEPAHIRRESIFLAGRYNKFSRTLSQTPWILNNGRKMESSVEEIISEKLKELYKAVDSRFSSSGREDVDVRMLGKGRPFVVELESPQTTSVSFEEIRKAEVQINDLGYQAVFVRDLQVIHRNATQILKQGEECKTKEYCAVCLAKTDNSLEELQTLLPEMPFCLEQKTPVRVLHRRTEATRQKTIHQLSIYPVEDMQPPPGHLLFKLYVTTQAGTYVKEFVHSDFGRTVPSISQMFGYVPVDVLALDVTNVQLDWPPPVDYESTK